MVKPLNTTQPQEKEDKEATHTVVACLTSMRQLSYSGNQRKTSHGAAGM